MKIIQKTVSLLCCLLLLTGSILSVPSATLAQGAEAPAEDFEAFYEETFEESFEEDFETSPQPLETEVPSERTQAPEPEDTPEATTPVELSPSPEPEGTGQPEEQPAPTGAPTQTPPPAAGEEAETPAPVEEPEPAIDYTRSAAFSPAFCEGLAVLLQGSAVYGSPDANQADLLLSAGGVLYVTGRTSPGGDPDRLSVTFLLQSQVHTGYVDAAQLRPLSPQEAEAYTTAALPQEDAVQLAPGLPLLPLTPLPSTPSPEAQPPALPVDVAQEKEADEEEEILFGLSAESTVLFAPLVQASGQVSLFWQPVPGAASYQVERAPGSSADFMPLTTVAAGAMAVPEGHSAPNPLPGERMASGKKLTYQNAAKLMQATDATAATGQPYTYRILPLDAQGQPLAAYTYSNLQSVQPAAASTLTVAPQGESGIRLTWTGVSGADRYHIYRYGTGDGILQLVKTAGGTNSALTDKELTPGVSYIYCLIPVRRVGSEEWPMTAAFSKTARRGLPQPSAPSVASTGQNSLKVTWTQVDGAARYDLYRATSKTGKYTLVATTAKTSYTDKTVKTGKRYFYKVAAQGTVMKTAAQSALSKVSTGAVPLAKATFELSRPASGAIKAKWTGVTGATGYQVYVREGTSGAYQLKKNASAKTRSYTFKGEVGKVYYVYIRAVTTVGKTEYLGPKSQTQNLMALPLADMVKGDVLSPIVGSGSVTLAWVRVPGATQYKVLRATSLNGTYKSVGTVKAGELALSAGASKPKAATTLAASKKKLSYTERGLMTYTDTSVKSGKLYYYKIVPYTQASGKSQAGLRSPAVAAMVSITPKVTVTPGSGQKQVVVTWTAVSKATRYRVYRYSENDNTLTLLKTRYPSAALSITDTVPAKGVEYTYVVVPERDVQGLKAPMRPGFSAAAQRGLSKPKAPTAQVKNGSQVTVTWARVSGASEYILYRSASKNGTYTQVSTTSKLSFIDTGAASGKENYYKIKASGTVMGTKSTSALSAASKAAVPVGIPTVTLTQPEYGSLKVAWTQVPGASGYEVYVRRQDQEAFVLQKNASANSKTYTFSVLSDLENLFSSQGSASVQYSVYVRAYATVSGKKHYGNASAVQRITAQRETQYRALLIGNSEYTDTNALRASYDDANGMNTMLRRLSGTNYQTTVRHNQTASQILSAISTAFSGATEDDVSLFYYSGHGITGSGSTNGALVGIGYNFVNTDYITAAQLRAALDQVPGKVVVILNSCGSGSYIGANSLVMPMAASTFSPDRFNDAFVEAFAGATVPDSGTVYSDGEFEIAPMVGELAASKYYVITAAKNLQDAYQIYYPSLGRGYSFFTYEVCRGGGYNYFTGSAGSLLADQNGDSKVTLHELYQYTSPILSALSEGGSDVRVYPLYSDMVLFKQ